MKRECKIPSVAMGKIRQCLTHLRIPLTIFGLYWLGPNVPLKPSWELFSSCWTQEKDRAKESPPVVWKEFSQMWVKTHMFQEGDQEPIQRMVAFHPQLVKIRATMESSLMLQGEHSWTLKVQTCPLVGTGAKEVKNWFISLGSSLRQEKCQFNFHLPALENSPPGPEGVFN